MLRITDARKQVGSVTAVDGVSFVAQNGAITGLLGPNGAGKTTTLRMLYGVMKPDSGDIRVDDVDAVTAPQQAQARLGVLPDGFGLYPRLTAREHLDYFGALHGIEGTHLEQRTEELIDLLDMGAVADRRTAGFSHGERTKVALARALVHDPQNVLLDEPTNGLDVMSTRAVRAIVREGVKPDKIDERTIRKHLYDPEMPDPDLMIRTSGEYRISNYLLWEIAYSELVFTDVLWPDFRREHLFEAVREYQSRERRFGGIESES